LATPALVWRNTITSRQGKQDKKIGMKFIGVLVT